MKKTGITIAAMPVFPIAIDTCPLTLFTCDYSGHARIAVRCQLNK